jgi:bacterioferritin
VKANTVIPLLKSVYAAELDTIQNYLTYLVWLDNSRAQEVFDAVAGHIPDELSHAKRLARRLEQLGVCPPSSPALPGKEAPRKTGAPSSPQRVVADVLRSKLDAIATYQEIIVTCHDTDPLTANLATSILADEEAHRSVFMGLLQSMDHTVLA